MALSKILTSSVADPVLQTNKNLIINGAMQVAQRGTSAVSVGSGTYRLDRFSVNKSNDGAYTVEQSTDAPTGFTTSLKAQVTTADTSLSAAQNAFIYQSIEAQNLQHLNYGTSDALTVTLSFWVKSSKTGVYTASLYKPDNTGYMFTQEYTISSANTWEKKTITITPTAGGTSFITTSGGAIANDNGSGIDVNFNLAFGSTFNGGTSGSWSSTTADYSTTNAVNWMDSTSNNFYLTGVQLEIGDATPFEHEDFGTTLAKCQRYFTDFLLSANNYMWCCVITNTNTYRRASVTLPVQMRASATGTIAAYTNGTFGGSYPLLEGNNKVQEVNIAGDVTGTGDYAYFTKLQLDAEL